MKPAPADAAREPAPRRWPAVVPHQPMLGAYLSVPICGYVGNMMVVPPGRARGWAFPPGPLGWGGVALPGLSP